MGFLTSGPGARVVRIALTNLVSTDVTRSLVGTAVQGLAND
jgi:hypothetical protein